VPTISLLALLLNRLDGELVPVTLVKRFLIGRDDGGDRGGDDDTRHVGVVLVSRAEDAESSVDGGSL
jgi:hypothetical protein